MSFYNLILKRSDVTKSNLCNWSLTLNMLTSSGTWALLRSKIVVGRRCFNVNLDRRAWKSRHDGQKGRKRKMAVLCYTPTDFWPLCRCDFGTSVINAIKTMIIIAKIHYKRYHKSSAQAQPHHLNTWFPTDSAHGRGHQK